LLKINALIVDDEPPARERLITLLAAHPAIEVVGEAGDVESAARFCADFEPDVIFLDIELPRARGFELLPLLNCKPIIIFITAHERFATRAFEVNAMDYLLKPIHPDRLAISIQRLTAHAQHAMAGPDTVALKEDGMLRRVPTTSISHIQASDNYSSVHLLNALPAFVRRSLTEWEKLLPPDQFVRVDRSLIVRIDAIQSLRAASRDYAELTLSTQDKPILLGRRAALLLRRTLQKR
jgi:two-component system, LytTR family, response regulator